LSLWWGLILRLVCRHNTVILKFEDFVGIIEMEIDWVYVCKGWSGGEI
jgi:hypothetical protein